jgi:hypothetical protein
MGVMKPINVETPLSHSTGITIYNKIKANIRIAQIKTARMSWKT